MEGQEEEKYSKTFFGESKVCLSLIIFGINLLVIELHLSSLSLTVSALLLCLIGRFLGIF